MDIAYQYLSFFEDDDEKMEELAREYRAGRLSTSQMKDACIVKLQQVVADFQKVSHTFPPHYTPHSLLPGSLRRPKSPAHQSGGGKVSCDMEELELR